jgi:phosphomannomutase/phosphoglucomutase
MLKPTIFREYDIRGIADVDLPSDGVRVLGQALGTYMQRKAGRKVNLGRDVRLSGPRLRDALLEGLIDSGCEVTDIGVVPTPLLYYSVYNLKADGAVQITGSHNPAEYNGFKSVCGGAAIFGQTIQEILKLIQTGDLLTGSGSVKTADVITPYVDEISKQFDWPRRIKVVIDAGNGAAGPAMHRLLERLNCDALELFFRRTGRFRAIIRTQRSRRIWNTSSTPYMNGRPIWASPSTVTPTASAR